MRCLNMYVDNNNKIVFLVGDAPPSANSLPNRQASITTNSAISAGKWYHVVAIKNTNNPNSWSIYVNNSNMAVTVTGGYLPSGNLESGNPVNLFIGLDGGTANPWHGKLSRVRLHKQVLTGSDVTNSYNSGCGRPSSSLPAELDAPLNTSTVDELKGRTGTPVLIGGGNLTYKINWVIGGCFSTDTVVWWCEQYLVKAAKSLRYAFNGKERDDEINGAGNSYDYGARIYDPRIGRWVSVDHEAHQYSDISSYSFAGNTPIIFVDPLGREIIDPQTGKQVVRVDGQWKSISRIKNGEPVYGDVSQKFKEVSQPTLDVLTSSQIGNEIYNTLQVIDTKVIIDTQDPVNTEGLKEQGGNSIWTTSDGDMTTDKRTGYYKSTVIITPDLKKIRENALEDGVSFEEKLVQTVSVEKDHIANPEQIKKEASYNYEFTTKEAKENVYGDLLNEAVRVGKALRTERGQAIDGSSNLPVEKLNKANKTDIKLTE